jgi:chemotaxis protein MotB
MQISMGVRGLTISFQQAAIFSSGDDVILSGAYASIRKIAMALNRVPNPARLEGHTDSIPIHNTRFRSNWELSAARGIALLEMLSSQYDVPRDRLSIAGYADTAPLEDNDTEQGRARNRRVDIVILNETGLQGEPARLENAKAAQAAGGKPSPDGRPSPTAGR